MNTDFIIKVCGMRDAANIRDVESLPGVDFMGFIFWPRSGRYVAERPSYLPRKARRVGVFVNEDLERVRQIAADYALDLIQLHGNESPEYVRQLKDWQIVKAINIATADDFLQTSAYEGLADYFLFDTRKTAEGTLLPGGTGEHFDWTVLAAYHGSTPFLLSGGIGPGDAASVKALRHPRFAGIDLNSRFELIPGLKDVNKLKSFIKQIKS